MEPLGLVVRRWPARDRTISICLRFCHDGDVAPEMFTPETADCGRLILRHAGVSSGGRRVGRSESESLTSAQLGATFRIRRQYDVCH